MSAIELLKTIESLVQVVNEKNRELEKLKTEYGSKINEINRYLHALHDSISQKAAISSTKEGEISDDELIKTLKSQVKCPQCDTEVWNNDKNTDFILLPRQKLQAIHHHEVKVDKIDQITTLSPKSQNSNQSSNQSSSHPPKPKKSAKKTCSFCHQTGHSRARCLQRLNNDSNSLRK